ncbi:hypothetical protein NVV94_16375 [Pseudomonas sp. LS1212]|uniref:hypothetical protein n=1 Tax=Pseudomonas sp. LS1212 TaxID=2972478 RepID=UPI00215BBDEB|nr:hypothetical protein [Pseudomonas sp. LS1212]UVJ42218.1 hypothetical protein NVV94_16375 [Pseudomonas sp. LS1212]
MSKEVQTIVTILDQQYEEIVVGTRSLTERYISASMEIYKKTGIKSVIAAVSIRRY